MQKMIGHQYETVKQKRLIFQKSVAFHISQSPVCQGVPTVASGSTSHWIV